MFEGFNNNDNDNDNNNNGPDPNNNGPDPDDPRNYPPIVRAARAGNLVEVNRLLDAGTDVNTRNEKGGSPLYYAAKNGDSNMIRRLLSIPSIDVNIARDDQYTPLIMAARYGHLDAVQQLLRAGANVRLSDYINRTALHSVGIADGMIEGMGPGPIEDINVIEPIVRELINAGANVNALNDSRELPLYTLAKISPTIIDLFTHAGFVIDGPGVNKLLSIYEIRDIYRDDIIERFLAIPGIDVNTVDRYGNTLLFAAVAYGKLALMNRLLEMRANPRIVNKTGRTLLHTVGDEISISNPEVDTRDLDEIVRILLYQSADPRIVANNGEISLHTMYLTPRIIDLIIPDDVNINTRDGDGKTPLHNACRFGYSSAVINKLLTVGANVNAETDEGQTALYLASEKGYDAIVAILLAAGADVNIADSTEDGLGFTPLHIASLNGYDAVVAKLLAAGANVNMVEGTMARAPLHAASIRGHDAVTAILLAAGASVNAMDNRENTPLWLASEHGHEAVVTRLLAAGADVNLASYNEQTPLCTAADYGRYEIVAILLAAGANVNTIDNSRKTPLYWASLHGDEAIVKLLLTDPVDPADPTLGRPSPISELDTYTPEIQALYDTYYKPVNMWTGFQLGLTSKSVDVINETITDYDKLLNSRIVRTPDGIVGTKYYNMDVAYCPICFIVLERGMNCNYVHHNCEQEYDLRNLKLSPTSKLLYDKHQERGQISICVICSRVCLGHIHTKLVPFAEVIRPAEPGRPEYKPTRNDLSMNPGRSPTAAEIALLPADEQIAKFDHDWTLDCRSYFNNPGGGTLEKIMRVHAFREKIKALEPERGKMLTNEAYKHILQAGWDAPINPTPEFKAVIKEEIRKNRVADAIAARAKATAKAAGANDAGVREAIIAAFPAAADVARAAAGAVPEATPATIEAAVAAVPSIDILRNRFNRPSSTFQGVIQGEEKESVNSIVYRTIWDVYRYPEVSWLEDVPSVDRPMYSPTVDLATAMNAIDLEDMPCQIVFKHRQSDNSRIIHSGNARFALHRIFVGDLAGTNTTADGALLSLKTRNRLWTTAGNFGACFMCTNSSTAGNCIIDIVSYPGLTPCTSKLYPQELQMALDKCTVLTAEERKTYQTILDEYRLKFNKHFASAEEKEKGAAIEKTYYLKIERAKAAARANNNAMQGKAGGLFNNINNGPAAPRRRKTRRRQRRAVTRKLRSRRIRSRQTRSRK